MPREPCGARVHLHCSITVHCTASSVHMHAAAGPVRLRTWPASRRSHPPSFSTKRPPMNRPSALYARHASITLTDSSRCGPLWDRASGFAGVLCCRPHQRRAAPQASCDWQTSAGTPECSRHSLCMLLCSCLCISNTRGSCLAQPACHLSHCMPSQKGGACVQQCSQRPAAALHMLYPAGVSTRGATVHVSTRGATAHAAPRTSRRCTAPPAPRSAASPGRSAGRRARRPGTCRRAPGTSRCQSPSARPRPTRLRDAHTLRSQLWAAGRPVAGQQARWQ